MGPPSWTSATASIGFDTNAASGLIRQWNFENGDLDGFQVVAGTSFNNQPTFGDNPSARGWPTINVEGDYFIGTYENRPTSGQPAGATQGDGPTGIIESEALVLVLALALVVVAIK